MRNSHRTLWIFMLLTVCEWNTVVAQGTENDPSNAGPQSRGLRKRLCKRYGICQGFGGQFGNGGFGGQFGNGGFGGYGGYPGQDPINIGISQSQSAAGGGGYGSGYYPNNYQYNQGYHNQGYGGYPGPFYNGYQRPGYNNYNPGFGYNNFNGNYYGPQGSSPFGYNQFNQGPYGYDEYSNDRPGYNGNRIENTEDSNSQGSDGEENSASAFSFAGRKRA